VAVAKARCGAATAQAPADMLPDDGGDERERDGEGLRRPVCSPGLLGLTEARRGRRGGLRRLGYTCTSSNGLRDVREVEGELRHHGHSRR
jgi:hypothetical protein